jgi:hypothetical protein
VPKNIHVSNEGVKGLGMEMYSLLKNNFQKLITLRKHQDFVAPM